MGLVSTWLSGIGLSSAVPTFQAAGIVTPAALAELDVTHFEALGISDPDDRRKLFYLVQRIKMAVSKDKKVADCSVEEQVDAVIAGTSDVQEEKKEDSSKEKKSKKSAKQSSPEKKKSKKTSTVKSPERRSRRLASLEERVTNDSEGRITRSNSPTITRKTASSIEEVLPKELQTRPVSPAKTLALPQRETKPKRQLLPPTNREETVPEIEENIESDPEKIPPPAKPNARKTTSRVAASKRASEIFNMQEEEDGAGATTAPPVRNSTSNRTSGLKKPTTVSTSVESKNQKSSKPQNPGKIRTGKPLSVIPSDEVEAISPYTHQLAHNRDDKVSTNVQDRIRPQNSGGSQEPKVSGALESMEEENDNPGLSLVTSSLSTTSSSRPAQSAAAATKSGSHRLSTTVSDLSAASSMSSRRSSMDPPAKSSTKPVPFIQGATQPESWSAQVQHLRDDNNAEYELFRSEEQGLFEFDMRIRVIVRKRPVSKAEASLSGGIDVIHPLDYGDYGKILVYQPKTRVDLTKEVETIPFAYDNVYDEQSTNLEIYQRSLRNLIQPFFRGQSSTVFAYGQTGSG
jgi:Kinesin motor domain/SAM domain (Sterile alpha motif)